MSNGVLYLLTGPKAAVRLVCSIWTLRKHYDGPIAVAVATDSHRYGCCLVADKRLGIDIIPIGETPKLRNATYVLKSSVWRFTPFDETVFLDADTTVHGPIDELWGAPLTLTRFSAWTTLTKRIRGRILKLVNAQKDRVMRALFKEYPAVNTGIFAFQKDNPDLRVWEEVTQNHRIFMADELVMQILVPEFNVRWLDDRYNYSALYGASDPDGAVIRHYHGKKHCHEKAVPVWGPIYDECIREDVAGLSQWTPAHDRRLGAWLSERKET